MTTVGIRAITSPARRRPRAPGRRRVERVPAARGRGTLPDRLTPLFSAWCGLWPVVTAAPLSRLKPGTCRREFALTVGHAEGRPRDRRTLRSIPRVCSSRCLSATSARHGLVVSLLVQYGRPQTEDMSSMSHRVPLGVTGTARRSSNPQNLAEIAADRPDQDRPTSDGAIEGGYDRRR